MLFRSEWIEGGNGNGNANGNGNGNVNTGTCDGKTGFDNVDCSPISNQSECEGKKNLLGALQCNWQE